MTIIDVLSAAWCIVPENLHEIQKIYKTHLRGDKLDLSAFKSEAGVDSVEEDNEKYSIINDCAVISIQGVIAKKMNLFSKISGGVSSQLVGNDIISALENDSIKGIVLYIDSPGGTVDGTQELSEIIFNGRDKKPIVAYTDGIMASAAYWIGSAAHEIYIASKTNMVGSIGVIMAHQDYSEKEKMQGVKTTVVFAGKKKGVTSEHKTLSEEGRQDLQGQVDGIYSIFVSQVAKYRNCTIGKVHVDMADGRIFLGQQAIDAGLVDGVSTIDGVLDRLSVLRSEKNELKELSELNNFYK